MSTAKPQQMPADTDSSEDLIAELAKLMAQDAQSSQPGEAAKPTAASRAMGDVPKPQSAGPQSPVRIPGIAGDSPGEQAAPAPLKFDFGKPVSATPVTPLPPLAWEDRAAPPVQPEDRHEPAMGEAPSDGKMPNAKGGDLDFDFGFGDRKAPIQPEQQKQAEPPVQQPVRKLEPLAFIERTSSFDPVPKMEPVAPRPVAATPKPVPAPEPEPAAMDEHDVIAQLIAAEFASERPKSAVVTPLHASTPVVASAPQSTIAPAPHNNAWANIAPQVTAKPASQTQPQRTGPVLRSVNLTPKQAGENDKFRTAPVFGLGGAKAAEPIEAKVMRPIEPVFARPVASIPPGDRDPIDEIESLIGEAVRVELGNPKRLAPTTPAVQPQSAQFAPRRSLLTEPEAPPAPRSSDEAILAAAADLGQTDSIFEDPTAKRRKKVKQNRVEREERPRGSFRAYVGPAVAGTLLLLAGFGLYWVLGMNRSEGTAPVLTADSTPAKQAPLQAAVDPTAAQGSVVFDTLDGAAAGALPTENIVTTDQADPEQIATAVAADTDQSDPQQLANRKVRTVTVRPDGTIVSGEDSVAGNNPEPLPVDRPNVPTLPESSSAVVATDDLFANVDAAAGDVTGTAAAPIDPLALTGSAAVLAADPTVPQPMPRPTWRDNSAVGPNASLETPATSIVTDTPLALAADSTATNPVNAIVEESVTDPPVTEVAAVEPVASPVSALIDEVATEDTTQIAAIQPAIEPQPVVEPVAEEALAAVDPVVQPEPIAAAPEETVAAVDPVEPAAERPAADATAIKPLVAETAVANTQTNAVAWVQVSSQRSQSDAEAVAANYSRIYGPLFDGKKLEIQRADLGAKGIYYRVRLPADSLSQAYEICTQVKKAGGDCFAL
jgi:SPOR domain